MNAYRKRYTLPKTEGDAVHHRTNTGVERPGTLRIARSQKVFDGYAAKT
jgi:hypothetical protein